ncbi:glycosyltransferase [Bacillus sp. X1(2014)]|uniref:glycosyltransferase n=1 Tax=Bacillus sp. X1(2014) TaxID=1565991 RepID=UPI0011A68525|nr:glycosyltransferase [Bacillus sp. X1(2014)]
MKILMVNKFYYIKGGSETYYFALKRMLEEHGHTVIDFSMKDEKNFESPYSEYFVDHVNYNASGGAFTKARDAVNIIYSFEAKRKFEKLIKAERPDLIHLHIFQHQISPSILDVIKKYHIPTVYTAHDLKMVCLNYKMMHHGEICEACKDGHFYHCAVNRCVKESTLKSYINVAEGYLHKWRKSYDAVGAIITPSAFYKRKFEEFGVSSDRIIHIPNFLDSEAPIVNQSADAKQYYLYFGRLSEEKGILTLINAVKGMPMQLYVVGTGPLEKNLAIYVTQNELTNVKLLGFKNGQELTDIVGNAKAVVLPSEWYENGPYSAIEALQLGRPIIGANIGGIPELVKGNGYLFESGNVLSLREALGKIEQLDCPAYKQLEQASLRLFQQSYTKDIHYEMLKKVYQKVGVTLTEG